MNRHHRYRRLAAIAACVGSTTAIAALGSAGSALAVIPCATPGFASGSSLQNTAMTKIWLVDWSKNTKCEKEVKITYTKTSSGSGLEEFGNNSGELHPGEDPTAAKTEKEHPGEGIKDVAGNLLDFFVASDDPPSGSQLSEAQHAAGATNGSVEITIPVAQAPVAVMLSLPPGCKVEEGSRLDLNNKTLAQLWLGTNSGGIPATGKYSADTWGAFLAELGYVEVAKESELPEEEVGGKRIVHFFNKKTVEEELLREVEAGKPAKKVAVVGEGCEQQIVPQVRSAESGTSFAFKTYLSQVNRKVWLGYANDLVQWPSSLVKQEDPKTSGQGVLESEGGGNLVENASSVPGSVGYANTADAAEKGSKFTGKAALSQFGTGTVENPETSKLEAAKSLSHQVLWAQVQNDGTAEEPEPSGYADPLLPLSEVANCETSKLTRYDSAFPYTYKDSWAGITTTDPTIAEDTGVADYPICALTYDLAWHHYNNANLYHGLSYAAEVANSTKDLMEYVVGQGQIDVQAKYYSRFPTAMTAHIREAAVHVEK